MKKYLLLVLLLSYSTAYAQQQYYIDFDTSQADSLLTIDTSANNIWQIGRTTKSFFHSSDSSIAIMTDTLNPYPVNSLSSFTFKFNQTPPCSQVYLLINHNFNTDSLKDGGYVEFSIDTGITWSYVSSWFGTFINDTIPAFTGTHNWD